MARLTVRTLKKHNSAEAEVHEAASAASRPAPSQARRASGSQGPAKKKARHQGEVFNGVCEVCDDTFKSDGSNWAATRTEAKKVLPVSSVCKRCHDFSLASGIVVKTLATMKKDSKQAPDLSSDMADFVNNRETPEHRDFETEEVFEETRMTSMLKQSFQFLGRTQFQKLHSMAPESAKLSLCSARDHANRPCLGVLVKMDDCPQVLDVHTEKVIVKRKHLLRPENHYYKRQSEHVFTHAVSKAAATLGQEHGGKYKPSQKPITVYTANEVKNLVAQAKLRLQTDEEDEGGALTEMLGPPAGSSARHLPAAVAPGASGSEAGDGDDESQDDDATNERGMDDGGTADDEDGAVSRASSVPQVVEPRASSGMSARSVGEASSVAEGARSSCLRRLQSRQDEDNMSVASRGFDKHNGASPRTHRPSYWLNVVTVEELWAGKNLNRQVSFAKACVARNAVTSPAEVRCYK